MEISKISLLVLLLLLLTNVTHSERKSDHGCVYGSLVNRETREPIVGGIIVITGSTLGAVTGDTGEYMIMGIPAGTYNLRVSALGYATEIVRNISVGSADSLLLNVALKEQSIEVGEVVIQSQRFSDESVLPLMHQLEYKEIHNTAGAFDDVIRTVSLLPGVAQIRPDRNDLIVRGGAPSENLSFVDNVEVTNINHFGSQGSSAGTVSFINFEFIDDFSFASGGFSAKYGDKLSSVLTLHLRDGRSDRFRSKVTISATQGGINLEGPLLNSNGSFLFSVRRSYLDPVFRYYGFNYVPSYWDFLFKAGYAFDSHNTVEIVAIGAIDRMEAMRETADQIYENGRTLFEDMNVGVGGVTWRHGFDNSSIVTTVRKSYTSFDYFMPDEREKVRFKNLSYEDEYSARIDGMIQLSRSTEFSAGIEGKYALLDSRVISKFTHTGFTEYPATLAIDTTNHSIARKGSTYLQLKHTVGNFSSTAGVRADYFDLIKNNMAMSERLSISYMFSPQTMLYAGYGHNRQSPSYIWLMTNSYNRSLNYLGVDQFDAGLELYPESDLKVVVALYDKYYFSYPASILRPYLVIANTSAGFSDLGEIFASFGLDFMSSGGKGNARGVELYVEKKISNTPYYFRGSLTYGKSEMRALDGISRPTMFDQRWIAVASGGYLIDEQWEATWTFRFSSGRPYTPFTQNGFDRTVPLYNTARSQANHNLGLRISRTWFLSQWNLITYLDIQNVYNKKWIDLPYWSQKNNREEVSPSIGIVPSLGIIAEF